MGKHTTFPIAKREVLNSRLFASCLVGIGKRKRFRNWQYAKTNGFVIVSRDSDFQERSLVAGHPPQVVWLKISNRSKTVVLNILLDHHTEIELALIEQDHACVEISLSNR